MTLFMLLPHTALFKAELYQLGSRFVVVVVFKCH